MMIRNSIQALVEGGDLTPHESKIVMQEIVSGEATNAQIAAFLTALRMKGETVEELVSFARVMRENCQRICPNVQGRIVDTCGTGGDKVKTFNISTAAAFVAAGAGVVVAKHGNRAVTSRSGCADVLELLGVNLNLNPALVTKLIEDIGIGFMYAPVFHPAMKYAVAPRKEVGIRTVFNLLGPLTNPASANAQVLGVYDSKLIVSVTQALKSLGSEEAMVVHGSDGLDEISTVGETIISHLHDGEIDYSKVSPRDFGVKKSHITEIQGFSPKENSEILFKIINHKASSCDPKLEIVLVNSAAAIVVSGIESNIEDAMCVARESIRSGSAYKKLNELIRKSGGELSKLEEMEKRYD
jgi:anthranilate phosphoribosyltransferase